MQIDIFHFIITVNQFTLNLIKILLKSGKLWIAITSEIIASDRWMKNHSKRGTFPFTTLFHSFRYDFRLSRYRRAKRRVIFNRLLSPSLLLIRTSRSHFALLTYPKLQTSDKHDSWKNEVRFSRKKYRSVGREA